MVKLCSPSYFQWFAITKVKDNDTLPGSLQTKMGPETVLFRQSVGYQSEDVLLLASGTDYTPVSAGIILKMVYAIKNYYRVCSVLILSLMTIKYGTSIFVICRVKLLPKAGLT